MPVTASLAQPTLARTCVTLQPSKEMGGAALLKMRVK